MMTALGPVDPGGGGRGPARLLWRVTIPVPKRGAGAVVQVRHLGGVDIAAL